VALFSPAIWFRLFFHAATLPVSWTGHCSIPPLPTHCTRLSRTPWHTLPARLFSRAPHTPLHYAYLPLFVLALPLPTNTYTLLPALRTCIRCALRAFCAPLHRTTAPPLFVVAALPAAFNVRASSPSPWDMDGHTINAACLQHCRLLADCDMPPDYSVLTRAYKQA